MFVKTGFAHLEGFLIASFDAIYVCAHRSELGTLIFQRRHSPTRRALFIELPTDPRSGTLEHIRDVLDPQRHCDEWLP